MTARKQPGFTLIELLIGLAIGVILLLLAVPMYTAWISDAQTANAASTVADGLRTAQAEAIRRNANVEFTLSGSGWTIQQPSGTAIKVARFPEGSKYSVLTTVPAGNSTVTFNPFGMIVPNATGPVAPFTQVNVTTSPGTRDLRVLVGGAPGTSYGIRVCDPNIPAAGDPKKCP